MRQHPFVEAHEALGRVFRQNLEGWDSALRRDDAETPTIMWMLSRDFYLELRRMRRAAVGGRDVAGGQVHPPLSNRGVSSENLTPKNSRGK